MKVILNTSYTVYSSLQCSKLLLLDKNKSYLAIMSAKAPISSTSSSKRDTTKTDEFRAVLNAVGLESGITISVLLHSALDQRVDAKTKTIDSKSFCDGLVSIKQVRQKFTHSDLADIFGDADEGEKTRVSVDDLVDFFQRVISKARALALKLRAVIMKEYKNESEYRKIFSTISTGASSVSDREKFTQFAEDMLQVVINDNDAIGLYSLYDMDGNGKVTADDFVGFLLGLTADAINALDPGNGEVIVDIKMSSTPSEESDLLRNGYQQIVPDQSAVEAMGATLSTHGTFGKSQSMWVWKRKQGTCSGRLRPVVDVQINDKAASSALVIAGYTCLTAPVSGQYVWVKKSASDDEDQDGIVDLYVTLGKVSEGFLAPLMGSRKSGLGSFNSPGVGWVRVDGNFAKSFLSYHDASLWMLPQRTRSLDSTMSSSMGVALGEEKRISELLGAVRRTIRHFVPTTEMKRLAKIIFEDSVAGAGGSGGASGGKDVMNRAALRSDRMFDFSATYHIYDKSAKGRLTKSQFGKLIRDAGASIDSQDLAPVYRYFDFNLNGQVSREEYAQVVSLTEYEISTLIVKIRTRLLASCKTETNKLQNTESAKTRAVVRANRVLSEVFRIVNCNGDGIISLDEVLDLTGKLEIFVTESEAQKIFKAMDTNGDGRVEESDFCSFMKRKSEVAVKTAHQVSVSASDIRVWVRQGAAVPMSSNGSSGAIDISKPWAELKKRHEKSTGGTFPDFLNPDDLIILVASLGKRIQLSSQGAKQLALLIAPEKCGRIQQSDLLVFVNRPVRSFGELLALVERDVMKPVFDAYKAYQASMSPEGTPNQSLLDAFNSLVLDTVKEVQGTTAVQATLNSGASHDIVAASQLKAGIEAAMSRLKHFEGTVPNVEEWASLGCLVGAVVTDEDTYGINPTTFVEGVCAHACGSSDPGSAQPFSLDVICKELQRMIRDEAFTAGKGQKVDYQAAFQLFDTDNSGSVTLEEFRLMLVRLQLIDLVPENELPTLMYKFDTKRKGTITYEDFLGFVDRHKSLAAEQGTFESLDSEDPLDMAVAQKPPFAISRNADCDMLAWSLWKSCCSAEPADPESVIIELEAACAESEITAHSGTVSIKELWNLLFELKVQGTMSKSLFERGVRFLVSSSSERTDSDQSQVDYSTLCRYIVRTGRAHKTMLEERASSDEKKYRLLKGRLKQELVNMMNEGSGLDSSSPSSRRFEKVFKRLDSDGDGKLSPQEFKTGLKRLGVKDEKEWNVRVIKLLFQDLDSDNDGFLSLAELNRLALDEAENWGPRGSKSNNAAAAKERGSSAKALELDIPREDDDDDEVFGQRRVVDDALLFAKVYQVLCEKVPHNESNHVDAIKEAIRKFFSRYDTDAKGAVSGERFRAFMRRSGLQDRLAAAELRRLTENLRRKVSKDSSEVVIDYENLCKKIAASALDGPQSRAEVILKRLQDASAASAASGRPFLSLCALVDAKFRGRISREEFQLTTKMMNCPLTTVEIEGLREMLPAAAFSADGTIDYKEINYLLTHTTPRNSSLFDFGPIGFAATAMSHPYSTPADQLRSSVNATQAFPVEYGSVYGATLHKDSRPHSSIPYAASSLRLSAPEALAASHANLPIPAGNYELLSIADKIRRACGGSSMSLRRVLESADPRGQGWVPGRQLLFGLEAQGINVTAPESMALQQAYGKPGDDSIDYDSLCAAVDAALGGISGAAGSARKTDLVYFNMRVAQRLKELQQEGRHPRDMFEGYDLDRTGTVSFDFRFVGSRSLPCPLCTDLKSMSPLVVTNASLSLSFSLHSIRF